MKKAGIIFLWIFSSSVLAELQIYSKNNREFKLKASVYSQRNFDSNYYKEVPLLAKGDNVYLHQVLTKIIPNSDWLIRIDEGLETVKVTYHGGIYWNNVVEAIDEQTPYSLSINVAEKVVAATTDRDEHLLPFLSVRDMRVFRLSQKRSVKENFIKWAESIDWNVDWRAGVDYPVNFEAVFSGSLLDQDGSAIVQVLGNINEDNERTTSAKLDYEFKHGNRVIVIYETGKAKQISPKKNKELINE